MITEDTVECSFKPGDRVRRKDNSSGSASGPLGTVQKVRVETFRQSIKLDRSEPPGITVSVLWDNGTLSHFVPEGLVAN